MSTPEVGHRIPPGYDDIMTESSQQPDLANAQVTGGGGHEPDPDDRANERSEPATTGSGIDLKSENLPDPND